MTIFGLNMVVKSGLEKIILKFQKSTAISYRTWSRYGEDFLPSPTNPIPHFMHGVQLGRQTRHPSFTKLMQLTYYVHLCLKFKSVENGGLTHNQIFFFSLSKSKKKIVHSCFHNKILQIPYKVDNTFLLNFLDIYMLLVHNLSRNRAMGSNDSGGFTILYFHL